MKSKYKMLTLRLTAIFLILVTGCSTSYVYKSNIRFDREDLIIPEDQEVGIAIFGYSISGLYEVIRKDVNRFAAKTMRYKDLSVCLDLAPDKMRIENTMLLRERFPNLQFAITVFESDPEIDYDYDYERLEKGEVYECGFYEKTAERDSELFFTTCTVVCEIRLYDIKKNELIATSIQEFSQTKLNEHHPYIFTEKTFLGDLERFFDMFSHSSSDIENYPIVNQIEAELLSSFFYYFLKHINNPDFVDFEKLKDGRELTPWCR